MIVVDGVKIDSIGEKAPPELQVKLDALLTIIGPKIIMEKYPDVEEYERIAEGLLAWGKNEMEAKEVFPPLFFVVSQDRLEIVPMPFETIEEGAEGIKTIQQIAEKNQAKAIFSLADMRLTHVTTGEQKDCLALVTIGPWINYSLTWFYDTEGEKIVFEESRVIQPQACDCVIQPWWDFGPVN